MLERIRALKEAGYKYLGYEEKDGTLVKDSTKIKEKDNMRVKIFGNKIEVSEI